MGQRENKVPDIKHGDLLISQHGSIGIVRDSFFNRNYFQLFYEISWFQISEKERNMLTYSVYYTAYEVAKMKRRVNKLRNKFRISS